MAGAMTAQAWNLGDLSQIISDAERLEEFQRGRDSMQAEILEAEQRGREQCAKEVAFAMLKQKERIEELEKLLAAKEAELKRKFTRGGR